MQQRMSEKQTPIAYEEMAELQQELMEENFRLRNEVTRIERMFEKIERSNRENKQERLKIRE